MFNPLNAKLKPICHSLALLGAHPIHISRVRVKNTQYLYLLKKLHKMQHLEGSGMPVLYIGLMVLKG